MAFFLALLLLPLPSLAAAASPRLAELDPFVAGETARHPGRSGIQVLEKGEESLLARAWLTDRAARSIDVQYFIWSTDNIGILAAEALLRAGERGVKVRVLVDDLLIDAPAESLLALAAHPQIEIRIYNPKHSVGVSKVRRLGHLLTDFRSFNQRMHDKTVVVDGQVAIIGGRNMADEYFDYDQAYNFRDRDVLLAGPVAAEITTSFEAFWCSPLAVPVEELLPARGKRLSPERVAEVYRQLSAYAQDPENFAPEVRQALAGLTEKIPDVVAGLMWDRVRFLSDPPGKNSGREGLRGGGETTRQLAAEVRKAKKRITIQTPYLIMPEGGLELFRDLIRRGVEVRISTNSLASTDNLQAFSGYCRQRRALQKAGIKIFEFQPNPANRRELIDRYPRLERKAPIFAIHAKTMVIDGETVFIGTFNLDPRSANLNTEVGVLIANPTLAQQVEGRIENDMLPENSWNALTDDPDARAPLAKRLRLRFWELLPLDALL